MTWAVAIAGLGFLVFIHELGHFVASIALGMRPRKFYIGFPPALVKVRRGGIEYGIGSVPLGGFVKIPGMHRPTGSDAGTAFGRAAEDAAVIKAPMERLRNALDADDHDAARDSIDVIESLLRESHVTEGPRRAAEKGIVDLRDALGPDAYWRAKTWKRVAVIAAGPVANLLLATVLFIGLFLSVGGRATTQIDLVQPGSPAAAVGLRGGDTIVAIDRTPVAPEDVSATISASKGRPLVLLVERDGRKVTLGPVAPVLDGDVYRLGFRLRAERLGVGESVSEAGRLTGLVTWDIVKSIGRLVTPEGRDSISSVGGIVNESSKAAEQGTDSFLWVLALISISLALLNLLPMLPLDGGHVVFAVIEGIRGRAVRREIYERASIVGIGLVLILFFIGVSNDVNGTS